MLFDERALTYKSGEEPTAMSGRYLQKSLRKKTAEDEPSSGQANHHVVNFNDESNVDRDTCKQSRGQVAYLERTRGRFVPNR